MCDPVSSPVQGEAVEPVADTEAVETILARHWREQMGMTSTSADHCVCGVKVYPAPGDDEIGLRRARAFARHQAAMLSPSSTREDGETHGAALITAERRRQVEVEGYSRDHDMHHPVRHFVFAAGAYLGLCAWPWDRKYFKPVSTAYAESHYVERNLVKAGALIAAAIDRLRASS